MGQMVDKGSGPPLVLIPGIQGRWEWLDATVNSLSKNFRVIAKSLPGEPGSPARRRDGGHEFDVFIEYVDDLLDEKRLESAIICGVSFGGLIAVRYAARRPHRVRALVLVSTPGPSWKPAPHQERQMRRPIVSSPIFAWQAVRRSWQELRVTYPGLSQRLKFCAVAAPRVLMAPAAPWRMGSRARLAASECFDEDCAQIETPTLVVAGERELDKVVQQDDSMRYVNAIRGAQFQLLERTGHLGTMSAPDRFAAIITRFARG